MKTLKKFFLYSLVFLVGLALFETYKWHHRKPYKWKDYLMIQFDSELGWRPLQNFDSGDEGYPRTRTNSLGFRSSPMQVSKDHIVMIGDGVVWGYGVSDDETIPANLEKHLDSEKIQVLNLGVGNYSFGQYYLYLKRHLPIISNLRAVILVLGSAGEFDEFRNDIVFSTRKTLFRLIDGKLVNVNFPIRRFQLHRTATWNYLMTFLGRHSTSFSNFLWKIAGQKIIPEAEAEKIAVALFKEMKAYVESEDASLYVFISPSIAGWEQSTSDRQILKRILQDAGIPYWDFHGYLREHFQRPEQVYLDDEHYHPAVNRLIAGYIADKIKSSLKLS